MRYLDTSLIVAAFTNEQSRIGSRRHGVHPGPRHDDGRYPAADSGGVRRARRRETLRPEGGSADLVLLSVRATGWWHCNIED